MPEKTLNTWKKLGLFAVDENEHVRLSPDLPDDATDPARLAVTLRRLVLAPRNNQNLWAYDDPKDHADRSVVLAEDFTRAACWNMMLPPLRFAGGSWNEVDTYQIEMFGPSSLAVQNDTRWVGYRAWAPFLGFGWWTIKNTLVADPTAAVRDVVTSLRAAEPLSQSEFLTVLAKELPVLDSGSYRREIEARVKPGHFEEPTPGHLSPTLSLAIQRLETAGSIELQERADAERAVLTSAARKPVRSFTHVVVREAPT